VVDASGFAVRGATVRAASGGRTAVTDAAGRFRLTGMVGGRHRLRIEHAGYPEAELEAETGTLNELRIRFGGALSVEVRDRSGGAPVAGAAVLGRGPGGEERRGSTGRDGRVELPRLAPGRWTVEARGRGYAGGETAVDVAPVSRARQLTAPPVRIELTRGATLAGVVRDRDGERVAGAAIAVGRAHTTSDGDGRFRLTDAPSGSVTVEAEKGDARGALAIELAPGDEVLTLELRVE
jgi:hypothetical protein